MLHTLLLMGVTGDLAGRYLLPALGALHAAGRLPEDFRILGTSTHDWDDAALRRHVAPLLERHGAALPRSSRDAILESLSHLRLDLRREGGLDGVLDKAGHSGPLATYLALPTGAFTNALDRLLNASLADGSRVAIEKPFGDDLQGARALEQRTRRLIEERGEEAVYLVDFLLGMEPAQNLLTLRRANPLLELAWRREAIERVELHWEETLGLEGRANYFDRAGILRDVVQNHVMQLLSLVAMELPSNLEDHRALQHARLSAIRAIRPLSARDIARDTRRARYSEGVLHGAKPEDPTRPTGAYVDQEGVDPARQTETFARLQLWVDNTRWQGVPFVIRAGKALSTMRKELVLHLRPALGYGGAAGASLRIGIGGPKDLSLTLLGRGTDHSGSPQPLTFHASPPQGALPAYARVLDDFLHHGCTHAVVPDEAMAAWELLTPVLDAWARDKVPMETYPAGSNGPRDGLDSNDDRDRAYDFGAARDVELPELSHP